MYEEAIGLVAYFIDHQEGIPTFASIAHFLEKTKTKTTKKKNAFRIAFLPNVCKINFVFLWPKCCDQFRGALNKFCAIIISHHIFALQT